MSDFEAKIHQIRFPLGLRSRPRSTRPLAVFKGPTSNGEERKEGGGEGKGKGSGGLVPQLGSLDPPVTNTEYLRVK